MILMTRSDSLNESKVTCFHVVLCEQSDQRSSALTECKCFGFAFIFLIVIKFVIVQVWVGVGVGK